MKISKLFSLAALALMMTACSDQIEQVQQHRNTEGIPFTATISIDKSASTRALTENGTTIEASWVAGEKVALIHNGVNDEMTIASVSGGVATITGSITGSPSDGDAVTVVYPYDAVDATTKDVKTDALAAQNGTLTGTNSIAEKYDVRKGTGTLKVSGTATLNGNVSLTNQVAIFKFTINNASSTAISVESLTILIGTQKYVITPSSATSTLYAALPAVTTAQTVSFSAAGSDGKNYVFSKAGVTFAASKYYQSTLAMAQGIHLATLTGPGPYTALDGDVLTGTLDGETQPYKITIAAGATVTLDGVTINGKNSNSYNWAGITCLGGATIILKDGSTNVVKGFYDRYPGIQAGPSGSTLIIKGGSAGTGSLTASPFDGGGTDESFGAGIGGGLDNHCGNIEIQGGTITASGGFGAAGIGSGQGYINGASCGTITISGGTITATGGKRGAGVGCGFNQADQYGATCGNITISGGTVVAEGGEYAAGIGGGAGIETGKESKCGTITITSDVTSVTATKSTTNPGPNSIGAGKDCDCGTVTIGGVVTGPITTSPCSYDPSTPVALSAVTPVNLGWIVGSDGNAYSPGILPSGVTAVAMVAYVGAAGSADASSSTYKGLALALTDASSGANWCTQSSSTCLTNQYPDVSDAKGDMAGIDNTDYLINHAPANHTHAAASAARNFSVARPAGTSEWFLPSVGQWDKMATAVGGYANLGLGAAAYWTSSERGGNFSWCFKNDVDVFYTALKTSFDYLIRPCFAF